MLIEQSLTFSRIYQNRKHPRIRRDTQLQFTEAYFEGDITILLRLVQRSI